MITLIPLISAQYSMLIRPDSRKTQDLLIGKGEEWRDQTHFRFARGGAWADWLFFGPLRYYTYFWGFFIYWGALALAYAVARLSGIDV